MVTEATRKRQFNRIYKIYQFTADKEEAYREFLEALENGATIEQIEEGTRQMAAYRSDTGYSGLANAIIVQAKRDLVTAVGFVPPGVSYRKKAELREDCLSFFASEWYENLTSVPADCIIGDIYKIKRQKCELKFAEKLARHQKALWERTKKIDWGWRLSSEQGKSRIVDKRHAELLRRVKWRKERLKCSKPDC